MKKIFTLLSVLLGLGTLSQAQVVMTYSSHGLKSGDTHASQEVEFKEQGPSGQNVVWDFSNLVPVGDADASLVGAEAGTTYNIGITRESDDVHFLYNVSENANEYKGYKSKTYLVTYDKPIVKTQYPQTYGSFFQGDFEGSIAYDERVIGHTSGSYSTEGDATGTILLPNGTILPVLRVKTTERIDQWVCGGTTVEIEKYLWYAQDTRYPVFVSMTVTTTNMSDNSTTVLKKSCLNLNINEPKLLRATQDAIAYTVSPNPFRDNITINYTLPQDMVVGADLYDAQGVLLAVVVPVQQQQAGEQTITFYAAPYTQLPGVYFLKIRFGANVYSEKITK